LKIHYEQAFIGDPEILKAVCVKMFPNVDAPGLNKDEVAQILDVYGWTKLARKIRAKCSAYTIYEGAEVILRMFKLKRVTIHTRDFVLSLLKPAYE
jgi:ADP-dependent phosphofructokinase/glucokinase